MLIRYRRSEDGKPVAKAIVYTQAEHGIDRAAIDPDALRIAERLRQNGHEAYIVGGAVRDLLLARAPKDFDLVTDAPPARIKRVFRSARVIGRRFRLVHVYCGPKIFEVSTFRSIANGTVGNEFGTIDEDARRRDFSLNALYYDPYDCTLVDYVGGFKDIAARRIEPVIPVKVIFKEDAVRMIRCVKYAATTGFRIPLGLRLALKRDSGLLAQAGASRLTEEFIKILGSGSASVIFAGLARFDLLRHMLPACVSEIDSSPAFASALSAALGELDDSARDPASRREPRSSSPISSSLSSNAALSGSPTRAMPFARPCASAGPSSRPSTLRGSSWSPRSSRSSARKGSRRRRRRAPGRARGSISAPCGAAAIGPRQIARRARNVPPSRGRARIASRPKR